MNSELIEIVRRECAGVYFEARKEHNPNFGASWEESTRLDYIANPHDAFSRVRKLFLPKPLKDAATRTSAGLDRENFNIHHYPLNEKRVEKRIKEMADGERFLWDRVKDNEPDQRVGIDEPIDEKAFFAWFKERFSPSTVIFSDLWSYSLIVGKREINQEIIDEIKQNPMTFFELSRELSPIITRTINAYQRMARVVHVCDMLKDPKEVHLPMP